MSGEPMSRFPPVIICTNAVITAPNEDVTAHRVKGAWIWIITAA